jgi:hypothetical protein
VDDQFNSFHFVLIFHKKMRIELIEVNVLLTGVVCGTSSKNWTHSSNTKYETKLPKKSDLKAINKRQENLNMSMNFFFNLSVNQIYHYPHTHTLSILYTKSHVLYIINND